MGSRTILSPASVCITDKCSSGVPRLIEDLARLAEDRETCDILFVAGFEEIPLYAHKLILRSRCDSFRDVNGAEICKVPGTMVSPSPMPGPVGPVVVRWPKVKPDILRDVIKYIYTGRIVLLDSCVFEVLVTSKELGIEELRKNCEDHIASSLNVHNACTFLAAALSLESRTRSRDNESNSFVQRCMQFIGDNGLECSKSNSFRNLPKDCLIHLVSSDNLAMEEEDVFRAVLEWAKNQAGVTQPTVHWSDEERQRVCHNLQGVIEHVRLLLIDSQVFAEEVEPTGAVPMEMSLERYRFAALPSKFQTDRRVQARKTNKLFQNSKLLTGDRTSLQKILNQWLGDPKQTWRLIYRASSHGFTAQSFHHHCDNQGPTMIIIQSANGNVAGGFTDISWDSPPTSRGKYLPSDKCFLFTLINNQDQPPTKFAIKKRSFAVVHHPDFGPVFGAGADLSIASDCNANGDSYSSLPHSYDGLGANSTILFGDDNFTVVDYEVFAMLRK